MIPLGRYVGRCVDYVVGFKPKSNVQQIEMRMEVAEGPEKGKQDSYYGGFVGDGAAYTKQAMQACGWDESDPTNLENLKLNLVQVVSGERVWEGKTFPQIKVYAIKPGIQTLPENRMDPKDAADFILSMFGAPANAKPAEKRMRQPGEDDDLAF
ncbi:MAG TPA: hypothetical protein DEB56_14730 [Thiobacillus sp.]|nr:hypothetical protein [Thiobacillus sp.]